MIFPLFSSCLSCFSTRNAYCTLQSSVIGHILQVTACFAARLIYYYSSVHCMQVYSTKINIRNMKTSTADKITLSVTQILI